LRAQKIIAGKHGLSAPESGEQDSMTDTIPTIAVDAKIGFWRVLTIAHKRCLAQCVCGQVREIGIEALESGASESCGCRPPSWAKNHTINEAFQERRRLKNFTDWKPLRGR
jgi:hypothetical protein